ncbi:hypothetical protein ACVWZT_004940 [Pseudomonas sp. TE21394]
MASMLHPIAGDFPERHMTPNHARIIARERGHFGVDRSLSRAVGQLGGANLGYNLITNKSIWL